MRLNFRKAYRIAATLASLVKMRETEHPSSSESNAPKESSRQGETGDLNYGYDFYPERRVTEQEKGIWRRFIEGRSNVKQLKCYTNVHWCIKNSEYASFF